MRKGETLFLEASVIPSLKDEEAGKGKQKTCKGKTFWITLPKISVTRDKGGRTCASVRGTFKALTSGAAGLRLYDGVGEGKLESRIIVV